MYCSDCDTELSRIVPKAKLMFRVAYRCPDCGDRQLDSSGAPDG